MRIGTKLILAFIGVACAGALFVGGIALVVSTHHGYLMSRSRLYSDLRSELTRMMTGQYRWVSQVQSNMLENAGQIPEGESELAQLLVQADNAAVRERFAAGWTVEDFVADLESRRLDDYLATNPRLRQSLGRAERMRPFYMDWLEEREWALLRHVRTGETDKEIEAMLRSIAPPYLEMQRRIVLIEEIWTPRHLGLQDRLRTLLNGHNQWSYRLIQDIVAGRMPTVETNPRQTILGQTLLSQEMEELSAEWQSIFDRVKQDHRALHEAVVRLKQAPVHMRARVFLDEVRPLHESIRDQLSAASTQEAVLVRMQEKALDLMVQEDGFLANARSFEENARRAMDVLARGEERMREEQESVQGLQRQIILGGMGIAMVLAIGYGVMMSSSIQSRVRKCVGLAESIRLGKLNERLEAEGTDELSQLSVALNHMADGLEDKANFARTIASGDLTRDVALASQDDVLGDALQTMTTNLRALLSQIDNASSRVSNSSGALMNYSSSLSEGAAQQAQALNTVSEHLQGFAQKATDSSELANRADANAGRARNAAEETEKAMQQLSTAMQEINEANHGVAATIQIVDEIAAQTKILALNATTEAIRAGSYGEGFAIVADEIKELANHTAQQAKHIASMIRGTQEKAGQGTSIAGEATRALQEIVDTVGRIAPMMEEIALASQSQAGGIQQINDELAQVKEVTFRSSSSADKGASAAEQLNYQAQVLRKAVSRFQVALEAEPETEDAPSTSRFQAVGHSPEAPVVGEERDSDIADEDTTPGSFEEEPEELIIGASS